MEHIPGPRVASHSEVRNREQHPLDETKRAGSWRNQLQLNCNFDGHHDPNSTLIQCVLDLATISLYQGLIFPPLEGTPGTWHHALRRCLKACDSMTNLL
ncbi:hypothetical protein PMIN01_06994 [Paraphaeosphaeria minitans]|uniref:Uncharacterized protein n=1 Tax=Paraphaeosphaeria minitans TaxID=565426 RepID=A0A9P6GK19_9PLEO|nr:hypothetical protein PMIN01_06994 [Paraphaeosphaeria minitans]